MTVTCLVSITIWSAAFLPTAWTLLTVGPENVTVQANQSTFMNCSTISGGGVKWFHNSVHVCTELQCYQHRFRVENINSTGSWNLIISSVQAEDAGDYRCEEIGFTSDKRSAQLIVSETEDTESSIGLPYVASASDTTSTATTIVTIAGGTIAAIIGTILGILVIIIVIVCVVIKKYKRKTQKREKEEPSNAHLQLLPVASHDDQRMGDEVYLNRPVLVKTIKTRIAKEKNSYVRAVSIFKDEVYVATDNSPEIEVYDVINLDLSRCFTIDCLINPLDIKPCVVNNCLYIFDCEYVGVPGKMLKIDCEGRVLANWPMEDSGARLSVASNGNVIVSLSTSEKIVEYMPNGSQLTQVREIEVPGLCHAIPLENGQFLISQGYLDQSELHRVFHLLVKDAVTKVKVGTSGASIINTFGGEKGSNIGEMNVPWYLAVDGNGCILVAERENQRVTLCNPTLKYIKILISEADGLRRPLNMLVDAPRGRLFVADFIWKGTSRIDGQLLVFQIRNSADCQV